MKKFWKTIFALTLGLSLVACSSSTSSTTTVETTTPAATQEAEGEAEEASTVGVYAINNTTGETVTELYVYPVGASDKGENHAGDGLAVDGSVEVTFEAESADTVLVLEFTTESGYNASFETLAIEEATINLLASVDVESGATPIEFGY